MPEVRNKDGQTFDVSDVDAVKMVQADPSLEIVGAVRATPGEAGQAPVSISSAAVLGQAGHVPASEESQQAYARHEYLQDKTSTLGAAARGALGGVTLGLSDALDPEQAEADATIHPFATTAGMIGGSLIPFGLGGEAELAANASKLGERTAAEHIAGGLSSKFVHAGEVGAAEGTAARELESTLVRGKGGKLAGDVADGAAARAESQLAPETADAISKMSKPELATARKAEIEAITTAREAEAPKLVEGLAEHRAASADDAIYLATKDADAKAIGTVKEAAKLQRDADFSITKMLNNPKALERNPGRILDALTAQENALQQVAKNEPELRTLFAADEGGARAAALDKLPGALERNRALQDRIKAVLGEKTSPALQAIDAARDALDAAKGGAKGLAGSAIASHVLGAVMPGAGHVLGAVLGPGLAEKGVELARHLFSRGARVATDGAAGAADAVRGFVSRAARGPGPTVLASRVLANAMFAPGAAGPSDHYSRISAELRNMTAYNAMGQPQMRPEARAAMAQSIAPLRMVHPLLADKVETVLARRVEFLSSKLPRRPDLPMLGMGEWHPSDMQVAQFARYVDAVNNPGDVEKRLAAGTLSPEDAEAYRAVFPERHQQLVADIMQEMSQSKTPVPYTKRLALWMFAGQPVDATAHPVILNALQSAFAAEPGTEGGTQAPVPQAAFGSISKSVSAPTPSQKRQG